MDSQELIPNIFLPESTSERGKNRQNESMMLEVRVVITFAGRQQLESDSEASGSSGTGLLTCGNSSNFHPHCGPCLI